jgi:Cdc6-like AAA superfamily ATPase
MEGNVFDLLLQLKKEIFKKIDSISEEIKEVNDKLDILSSDHPVCWVDDGSDSYYANIFNMKVKNLDKEDLRRSFCIFLRELETNEWVEGNFIENLSDGFKKTCAMMFNFPLDHNFYVRECYEDLFNKSFDNGIYLLSGSPGTGKTTFIIYHMKKAISYCRKNKLNLVCSVNCYIMYYFY